jgi:hypothetical protein
VLQLIFIIMPELTIISVIKPIATVAKCRGTLKIAKKISKFETHSTENPHVGFATKD